MPVLARVVHRIGLREQPSRAKEVVKLIRTTSRKCTAWKTERLWNRSKVPGHVPCSEDDSQTHRHTSRRADLICRGDVRLPISCYKFDDANDALVAASTSTEEEVFPVVLVSNLLFLLLTLFDYVTTSCLSALWTRLLAFISTSFPSCLLSSPAAAAARCGPYLGMCLPLPHSYPL